MRVKFQGILYDLIESKEIKVEAETDNVRQLIDRLTARYGQKVKEKLLTDGKVRDDLSILVNEENIVHLNGLKTELTANDEVIILSQIIGG